MDDLEDWKIITEIKERRKQRRKETKQGIKKKAVLILIAAFLLFFIDNVNADTINLYSIY